MKSEKTADLQVEIMKVLREADRAILSLAGKSHHLLYQMVHHFASQVAPVDSFYVGFYLEEAVMVFPYSFDDGHYDDPEKFPYAPDGLSAIIRRECRAYRYDQDGGLLLNKGKSFGDIEKLSRDCVVVPIVERGYLSSGGTALSAPLGVMGILSYAPDVYGDQEERAFQWLADAIGIVLTREQEDAQRQQALGIPSTTLQKPVPGLDQVVSQTLEKMAVLRLHARRAKEAAASGDSNIINLVNILYRECEQLQTETIEVFLNTNVRGNNPIASLSDAERKVAELLATAYYQNQEYRTSREIADELYVTEATISTHRKEINRKLGIAGKPGVRQLANWFFGSEMRDNNLPR